MKVIFSAQAKAGLREVGLFIAQDNKVRAISFVRELRTKAMAIGKMPRAYPMVPRFERYGIRRRPHGNYLIFYRIEDDRIVIVHVLHAAREHEALLFPQA
jgi:plasmid stabilization system protein ParE